MMTSTWLKLNGVFFWTRNQRKNLILCFAVAIDGFDVFDFTYTISYELENTLKTVCINKILIGYTYIYFGIGKACGLPDTFRFSV